MMKKSLQNGAILLGFIFIVILNACNDDEGATPEEPALAEQFITAMGGEELITANTSIQWESTGQAFEFQQDPEPVMEFVADFDYTLTGSSNFSMWQQAWDINADYAFETSFNFTETVVNNDGLSEGSTGFFPTNFAGFGVPGDPMYSTKLAARRKTLIMSSPLALAQLIIAQEEENIQVNANTIAAQFNSSPLGLGASTPDIWIEIDTENGLPTRTFTTENDPLLGDVLYEVQYSNIASVNGLSLPTVLTHILNGQVIRTELLRNISLNVTEEINSIDVSEEEAFPYDETEALAGYLSSQFHFRTLMQTFPMDFPPTITDANFQGSVSTDVLAIDPTILRIAGDLQSHYTFAFDLGDSIIIYDTPVNNRRMNQVLGRVRQQFGDTRISDVIISHDHFDHSGGVRAGLAEGGRLIVGGEENANLFSEYLTRPHTILPNPLNREVTVIGLRDPLIFGSGETEVQFHVLPNSHTIEGNYILAYKPAINAIFLNDIHNPGFQFVFDNLSQFNRERMVLLAQELVTFIENQGWDIDFVIGTHGFPDANSTSFSGLLQIANSGQ